MFAGLVAGGGDGFEDDFEGFFVGFQIGREAAFIADGGGIAALVQHGFQIMKDFDAHAQGFAEIRRADGHDHEFLQVHGIIGVRAAVENVHHGDGKRVARTDRSNSARDICRAAVRAAAAAARAAAMETARMALAPRLPLFGVPSASIMRRSSARWSAASSPVTALAISAFTLADGFQHAFAEVARFIAVAQFDGFVLAGGCAGGNRGAADARRLRG